MPEVVRVKDKKLIVISDSEDDCVAAANKAFIELDDSSDDEMPGLEIFIK